MLYDRLDEARARTVAALRTEHARRTGTRQALVEREVAADEHVRRLAQLTGSERALCFGRIDAPESLYIGRIGLRSTEGDVVLVDWRAPAARPFYAATPSDPGPVVRRRHLRLRDRVVVGLDDEVFDLSRMTETDRHSLVGEAALLASLRRGRTGRMGDVVATIQTEQDRVIRSGLPGVLVVQGGPGTGKTVAALHRAAYLLYTHRATLERRGVLVVGPNPTFLRYIGQVLPSLGETDVVLSSVGSLFPGVLASAVDEPEVAILKGSLRMVAVLAEAVRDRQRVAAVEIAVDVRTSVRDGVEVSVEQMTLRLGHDECLRARDRARAFRAPHNVQRRAFVRGALRALALDEARQLDRTPDDEELGFAAARLWGEEPVRTALDALWPLLTPERLVCELLSSADAAGLSASQNRMLVRPIDAPWTISDVPLLDEAAELLDEEDTEAAVLERAEEREREAAELYAQGVLEFTGLGDVLDAETLALRHRDEGPAVTTAERAAADRRWAYGHVIVDEAQELSAMAWRMVMRRIPTRSLTIVGDLAQTGSPAGARSWDEMLDTYVQGRWREERLTVNYRTPLEIMEVAADVLHAVAPSQHAPESVRSGESAPRAVPLGDLQALVKAELAAIGEGRLAIICPDARHAALTALYPLESDLLDSPVAVLTVVQSKGLEFDTVLVVAPDEILAQSPKGGHDLYVAITRATRRLTVLHERELPEMLNRLRPVR
ncbi:MAG TPA: ATP-binding domain-containing protein [Streptosporangiaceae bacterium]|nr:ATP-binding domain-containing protein [Streptosporangiaceae bacterium]